MALINLQQTDNAATHAFAAYCSTNSNTGGTTAVSDCRSGGTAGTTPVSYTILQSETTVNVVDFISPAIGVTNWASGTYTIRINITSGTANVTWEECFVCRINSSGVNQETIGSVTGLALDIGSTGVQTANVTGNATTADATDSLGFVLVFTNSNMHNDRTGEYTPDQIINTPIDDGLTARRIFIIE